MDGADTAGAGTRTSSASRRPTDTWHEALRLPLAHIDGSVRSLVDDAAAGPILVVVVERDCPTSQGALRALRDAGGAVVVLSQGRPEAARALIEETDTAHLEVLIEVAPYAVSSALDARTVPTFVLVDAGQVLARQEGWDRAVVAGLVERVGGELTGSGGLPELKPGCQSRHTLDAPTQATLQAADAELGDTGGRIEDLWELGWHDGLPVVPPTRVRVRAMLDGRDPATSLGPIGPVQGEVTFERLAVCAVLAGCDPSYWPVVEAAVRAVMDPAFNAHGVINTTHFASPWIIVNGPVREAIGMNAGSNVLGPGNRANATIGRAVRLLMQLTGGGTPGGLDQSTLGGQHKYTACLPEREEVSPWEPWHVTLGHDPNLSTVTVMTGESPAGVNDHGSSSAQDLATTLALAMGNAQVPIGSPAFHPVNAETLLILSPEHATTLGDAGWSKQDLREFIVANGQGKHTNATEVMVVVAGGDAGRFSAVVAPWVGHGKGSKPVTRVVADRQ
jgi:hypothetical protein